MGFRLGVSPCTPLSAPLDSDKSQRFRGRNVHPEGWWAAIRDAAVNCEVGGLGGRGGSRTAPTVVPLCPSDISPAKRGQPGPPLRKAKGTRAKHAGDARNSPQQHRTRKTILSHTNATVANMPETTTTVPSPARRERARVRATGRPRGADHPNRQPLPSPQHPLPQHPSLNSFPILDILVQSTT